MPDYSGFKFLEENWGKTYHHFRKDIPHDVPEPRGKAVQKSSFYVNLMSSVITGRSRTRIIHLLDKTPIERFSKSQSFVKKATYGS